MSEYGRNVFLAVVIGLVAGVGLLVGISTVVARSLEPTVASLQELTAAQTRLEAKVTGLIETQKVLAEGQKRMAARAVMPPGMPPGMPPEDTNVYNIPQGQSYAMGPQDAPVTIVEFSDLQCPYCSRFHFPLMEAVAAFPGKVRVIFKNYPLPFHPNARSAAKAALAAGAQGKYFDMLDELLKNQTELSEAKYIEVAGKIGLDVEKFKQDLKDRDAEWEQIIKADEALVKQVKVPGTPTYFLNGKKNAARDVQAWKQAIEQVLSPKPAGIAPVAPEANAAQVPAGETAKSGTGPGTVAGK